MENEQKNIKIFKYNMSFYYQSTIIYFVAFLLYAIIRGEFVENSFKLITKDPIIYFFAIIVCVSLIALLYNLYLNRHLEISDNQISFISRRYKKTFLIDQISEIKIFRSEVRTKRRPVRFIRLKIKNRRRRILIRTYYYENEKELIAKFHEIKERLES